MKGKFSAYFAMPNLARFRSRVENPSSELTKQIREQLSQVICDVVNGHSLEIKAKMIEYVNSLNLNYKSDAHKAKVMSVVESFFDIITAPTAEALNALVGEESEEEAEKEEKPAKAAKASKKETKADDPEDFD